MPIIIRQNQYQGVNAHLHSQLQAEDGGWEVFHVMHIAHLAEAINALLPDGYTLDPEKSMQTRQYHPDSGLPIKPLTKYPDVTIYDYGARPQADYGAVATLPTLTLPASASLELDLDEQSYLRALVIREVNEDHLLGKPVTWIELLSPTNKPPRPGYHLYQEKRSAAVQMGMALVEIDYLHETPSPIPHVPNYPEGDPQAFPYTVVITNPRPNLERGNMEIYGFVVDEPLPRLPIPLSGADKIVLDLNHVYHRTFNSLTSFSLRVDYEQHPRHWERYHPADQARIQQRMQQVIEAHQKT